MGLRIFRFNQFSGDANFANLEPKFKRIIDIEIYSYSVHVTHKLVLFVHLLCIYSDMLYKYMCIYTYMCKQCTQKIVYENTVISIFEGDKYAV